MSDESKEILKQMHALNRQGEALAKKLVRVSIAKTKAALKLNKEKKKIAKKHDSVPRDEKSEGAQTTPKETATGQA